MQHTGKVDMGEGANNHGEFVFTDLLDLLLELRIHGHGDSKGLEKRWEVP